ncbi:hypothetical protein JBL43_08060 [Aureibaculum sp. A20]|uniref:Uncharacterized protein n=1 Tax=Aureibaculum flavum TaxID=2795986 RepID=A0ABS0WQD3_9FLAO|nr:hypothetical protein [Aureibaculum flavum]MBJ2174188.1 hypothetical protein [Aureibaculum flavum]
MNFTKYFSLIVKQNGVPHLNNDQFRRFMNIVSVEAKIEELQSLNFNSPVIFKNIEMKKNKLSRLTKDQTPKELLKQMVALSTK